MRTMTDTGFMDSKAWIYSITGYLLIFVGLCWWLQNGWVWAFFSLSAFFIMFISFRRARIKARYGPLVRNVRLFEKLFEHNPDVICLLDAEGRMIQVNGMTERVLGYTKQQLAEGQFTSILQNESLGKIRQLFEQAHSGITQKLRIAVQHQKGYRVDLEITAVPLMENDAMSGMIMIGQDITSAKRTEEQMRHMAFYDDKTGLPNRRLFLLQLEEAMGSARNHGYQVAVFYLDIDRFKIVNDCFGHDYGDMLLLQLAERFTRCVAESDLVARIEGDEFALLIDGVTDQAQVLGLADTIFHALAEPFILGEYQLHVTASIGIALSTPGEQQEEADALTKCANMALSWAKEKGRQNYQVFNSDMQSVAIQKLTLESELRTAIEQQELILHYQPQMDIKTGAIVGFEALVRWQHPKRGIVSPIEFIPFSEETGLIVPIGEWVMKEACRQNKLWQDQGLAHVPISVNLSTRQFLQQNLSDKVNEVLKETGLSPSYLVLEITESSTMDVEHASRLLLELKSLGIKISIDDFGTGYSSLSYLKKFPIDKLKIDQSFVRDIMTDPNDAAIVASIISMTRHMNLKVIAEGVETEEQLGFLHTNHCNEIQGYWFSPPLSAGQAEQLLLQQHQTAASLE